MLLPLTAREMFARMIKCEAGGEGDDGMKAVASVIMNRVNVSYGEFLSADRGDLRQVLTQPGQFTCFEETVGGQYNAQNIFNMRPEQIHYDIADWALSGNILGAVGESLWYFNPYSDDCPPYFPPGGSGVIHTRVRNHCFYTPTMKYAQT
jgi:N-acetylmuramoyl-L-alanine amidase